MIRSQNPHAFAMSTAVSGPDAARSQPERSAWSANLVEDVLWLSQTFQDGMDEVLRRAGVTTTEYMVLSEALGSDDATLRRLTSALELNATKVSRACRDAVGAGLLTVRSVSSSREHRFEVTPRGFALLQQVALEAEAQQLTVIGAISQDRLRSTSEALQSMRRNAPSGPQEGDVGGTQQRRTERR